MVNKNITFEEKVVIFQENFFWNYPLIRNMTFLTFNTGFYIDTVINFLPRNNIKSTTLMHYMLL